MTRLSKFPYQEFSLKEGYVDRNLEYRDIVINKSLDNPDFQALLMSMSGEDFLFWMNTFVYTYNPREARQHIPFVTFPYQDELALEIIDAIETGEDIHIDKSRDMGLSWLVLAIFVWGWLFKDWELRVGSRNRDYVDKGGDMNSLFEKMRYILERIPSWMLPYKFDLKRGTQFNSAAKLVNSVSKNAIVGEATSPNFARGGRSKAILYDEFAFWTCADDAWKGGADTTNCRILISTPNGMNNKFADVKFDEGLQLRKYSILWKLHPFKDEEWYQKEKERRTPQELAQEVDISYTASASNRVYEDFVNVPIGQGPAFDYNPELPLYRFWDFSEGGSDQTAIIWAQEDPDTKVVRIIDCFQRGDTDINFFGHLVSGQMTDEFFFDADAIALMDRQRNWKNATDIGDPYSGKKKTFVGQTTIKKELGKHGVILNLKQGVNSVIERIRITTLLLKRLVVHERCAGKKGFAEAMQNSRWPKRERTTDSTSPSTKPVHNQYSHFRTALEYGSEYLESYASAHAKKRIFRPKRKRKDKYNRLFK